MAIARAPHRAALLPYLVRAGIDHYSDPASTTPLQRKLVAPLLKAGLLTGLIEKFMNRSPDLLEILGGRYLRLSTGRDADAQLDADLRLAGREVMADAQLLGRAQSEMMYQVGTSVVTLPPESVAAFVGSFSSPPTCPSVYQMRLEYRGITTHSVGDRWFGGVEPYMLTDIMRSPRGTDLWHKLDRGLVIKHSPSNLGSMSSSQWSPSGGDQNSNGDPKSPRQFFAVFDDEVEMPDVVPDFPPNLDWYEDLLESQIPDTYTVSGVPKPVTYSPLLLSGDLHLALLSVWELDGDQSAQALRAMSDIAFTVAGFLPGIPGVVLVGIGSVMLLGSYLTAGDDDHIGAIALFFSGSNFEPQGYIELSARVREPSGDNDWTIYLGRETRRLS